jgi:anti-sigma B factor antagonist
MQEIYKHYLCTDKPNVAVIELPANVLGGNEALDFSSIVDQYNSEDNISKIIIDMVSVELINSSGLGMLVNALSKVKKYNKLLILSSVPSKVANLLKITHLNEIFVTYENLQTAISNA